MLCARCGSANREGAVFCIACGAAVNRPATGPPDGARDSAASQPPVEAPQQSRPAAATPPANFQPQPQPQPVAAFPPQPQTTPVLPPQAHAPLPGEPAAEVGLTSGQPARPAATRSRGLIIALIIGAILVVVAVAGVALSRQGGADQGTAIVTSGDAGSSSGSTSGSGSETTSEPAPSDYSYSAATGDASAIRISARAAGLSQAEGVADTLSKYYGGINARNWSQVWDQYTPTYQGKHGSVSRLANDARTSHDFDTAIRSIARLNSHMLKAYVTFTSTQVGSLGPVKGETRTNWRLDYDFRRVDGLWLINGTEPHSGSGHSPG
jgi:hypothetical protein